MLQICLLGASLKIKDITRRARRRCGAAAEGRLRDRRCVVRLEESGGAASRAGAFGAKGVGIEIVRLAVLLGICGCHAGSAVGQRPERARCQNFPYYVQMQQARVVRLWGCLAHVSGAALL